MTTTRRLRVAHVIRDGGGTAPVELTVATKLRDRGHHVTVYGPPEVGEHARAAGFDLTPVDLPPGGSLLARLAAASEAWATRLTPRFRDDADLVVADCMAFGAVLAAKIAGTRCAALMPTTYVAGSMRAPSPGALADVNRARDALGLSPAGSLGAQLLDVDRLLVLSSRAFELPEVRPPEHVRYVGPQLARPEHVPPVRLPDGDAPLVLVGLSTTDQGQLDLLRRLITALAGLPVRALITTGPVTTRLDPPATVVLERFVPHAAVLPHASLVVTHAGHGTVMAAIKAGVPMVCVPMSRDQPAVAARVARHGLGVRVPPDAEVAALRSAIEQVLGEPAHARATRRMAHRLEPAERVVDELETLAAQG